MRTRNVAITSWIVDATVALLPVLACFLGGSTQKWEEGIVITVLAICLLVRPPRFSLGVLTNLALLALLVLATVAFFPGRWFFQPEWRATLVNDFGIQLPSTLTPQPWITLGYLVSFAAGLSWLYVVSTQDLGLRVDSHVVDVLVGRDLTGPGQGQHPPVARHADRAFEVTDLDPVRSPGVDGEDPLFRVGVARAEVGVDVDLAWGC